MNENSKKIKLFQDFDKFFTASSATGTKGFCVFEMRNNEFGIALSDLGVNAGWIITECENKKLGNKMFAMLKNQMVAISKKNSDRGYIVLFEKKKKSVELSATTTTTIPPLEAAAKISTNNMKDDRKSSYDGPKTCELIDNMGNKNKKKIKMYQEYNKFFSAGACDGNKGFIIKKINSNEFGNALNDLGINKDWKIIECANKKLGNKMFAMLKNQILAAARKDAINGYNIIFENTKQKTFDFDDKKIDDKHKKNTSQSSQKSGNQSGKKGPTTPTSTKSTKNTKSPKSPKSPRTPRGNKQSIEIINDENDIKTIRLFHNIDKYIKSSSEKGPKGYLISAFNKKFGDDLKECGVDIGWKLVKLGPKDVTKAFYQMTKTNVDVEFKNSKNKGYQVTFAAPQ
eukprot:894535_1